ncbi:DNA phosphorothioation system sulfurtransferase DndC [Variovorax sp. PBL-E5]|uniref:DNA phosphorothioation system sulfurtransferase DndC n=1 Tax=Variovorax sp. PBL-E5 TaxID=434014 RepID=UPI00131770A5|nr:DNA phosphorothioation system sulfurtransferase DndC [Variovorax sp. PBL-E5]VTU38539.1 putative sulfurtransferase DndC [Variovorax sp. PBL-E5]
MECVITSKEDILTIYKADNRPWVIGFSGGKDSTAVCRLVFEALLELPLLERTKPVFIVSSDTLVETPLVVNLIHDALDKMRLAASELALPIEVASPVTPQIDETFWVNLIGKGYPAPTRQFRWCTERMKIDPTSEFIREKVAAFGEVVVVLGSRLQESSSRAQVMRKHRIDGSRLGKHTSLPHALVFTPIDEWSADDVWEYLFSGPAPWGGDHQALFDLYKGSNGGECPLVLDTSTPSCGNSRFGCWVCTVVTKDRAMDGLIETGNTWLTPLRDFRNELYRTTDPARKHEFRSARRRDGSVTISIKKDEQGKTVQEKHVLGPYRMEYRKHLLKELLATQKAIYDLNPEDAEQLISLAELEQIRKEWRLDPNEPDWEDSVPAIYRQVFSNDVAWKTDDDFVFDGNDANVVAELCSERRLPKELLMKLLELEVSYQGHARRSGLQKELQDLLSRDWADDKQAIASQTDWINRVSSYDDQERDLQKRYADIGKVIGDAN